MAKTKTSLDQLSFEQALDELKGIITAMENESRDLQETLVMFERGKDLIAHCQNLLDQAELKIRTLGEQAEPSPMAEE
jgi:exodeoxyribonuclease VII small subunit